MKNAAAKLRILRRLAMLMQRELSFFKFGYNIDTQRAAQKTEVPHAVCE
jgi:hypothetical protein